MACLVYGGAVEYIQMRSSADGVLTASVRFMDADACTQYYDDTSNGIVYKKDVQNRESVAFVELAKYVNVVGGMLQQWIDNGVTRCVRAVGVDEEWGTDGLKKIAERKNRKLEGISDSKNHGGVSIDEIFPNLPLLINALAGSFRDFPLLQDRGCGSIQERYCTRPGVGALQCPLRCRPLRHSNGRASERLGT